jgi:hypothetical protein
MAIITLAVLHQLVETDLSDAALQLILDATDEELTAKYGAADSATEVIMTQPQRYLYPHRKVKTLTSVTERESDGTTTTLDISALSTADVRLVPGNRMLERLLTGTNPRTPWAQEVTIVYVPDDINRRNDALAKLVQLRLEYDLKRSESSGDYSAGFNDYDAEKAKVIANLCQWGLA